MLPGPFPLYTPGGGYGIQGSPSTGWSFIKTAEVGVAEAIWSLGVSDSALRMEIRNIHAGAGEFIPCLIWPANGAGLPTQGTRSSGTRFVNGPTLAADAVDHGIGYTTNVQWYSVGKADAGYRHSWYGGESEIAFLRGDATFNVNTASIVAQFNIRASADNKGAISLEAVGGGATGILMDQDGNYGFLDYDKVSTEGVRLSSLTKVRVGVNTNAAYGSSTFTDLIVAEAAGVNFDIRANFRSYTVATLPAAGAAGGAVYVSDASGSPCLAISNGSVWKRCDDMTVTVT